MPLHTRQSHEPFFSAVEVDVIDSGEPIHLYYWAAEPNFGDLLSHCVVEALSNRPVVHARPRRAEVFAVGSLMNVLEQAYSGQKQHRRPIIWGTGMMIPTMGRQFVKNLDIRILRGPVTAALLRVPMKEFGDPGLFAPDAFGSPPSREDRIVVIPHHRQMDSPAVAELAKCDSRIDVVDPRAAPETVCHRIARAAHVFSASLHGLVVADAYGIRNTWVNPGRHPLLKYFDYAAGIGRELRYPVDFEDIATLAGHVSTGPLPYAEGIPRAREALRLSFPQELLKKG